MTTTKFDRQKLNPRNNRLHKSEEDENNKPLVNRIVER